MTRWWLIPAILVGALIWAALFAAAKSGDPDSIAREAQKEASNG